MKRHYLTFEKSLKDLDFEIEKLSNESDKEKLNDLKNERIKLEKEIFSDLSSVSYTHLTLSTIYSV